MAKTVVQAAAAGAPVGPYSRAVMVDGFIFGSAEKGVDPATGKIVQGCVRQQRKPNKL
jgi:2-iminobutanoate/2-iminopropanoate deaminase